MRWLMLASLTSGALFGATVEQDCMDTPYAQQLEIIEDREELVGPVNALNDLRHQPGLRSSQFFVGYYSAAILQDPEKKQWAGENHFYFAVLVFVWKDYVRNVATNADADPKKVTEHNYSFDPIKKNAYLSTGWEQLVLNQAKILSEREFAPTFSELGYPELDAALEGAMPEQAPETTSDAPVSLESLSTLELLGRIAKYDGSRYGQEDYDAMRGFLDQDLRRVQGIATRREYRSKFDDALREVLIRYINSGRTQRVPSDVYNAVIDVLKRMVR